MKIQSRSPLPNNSPIPKYYQLREILREQLSSWNAHGPIPSEAELCRMFDVSRTTVRKALEFLVYEGLLYRVQGKGTYVAPPKVPGRYVQVSEGFAEDMTLRGISYRTVVLEKELLPAPPAVASQLALPIGDEILRMRRLRYLGDETAHISTSHVPHRLCPGILDEDFTTQSLYCVMREKYGIRIHHGSRLIEVQMATDEEAELLGISPVKPLLIVIGAMYDEANAPVEFGWAKNRGDRSQLEIQVVPPANGGCG
jgi:GntR family transcriptional regulator